MKTIAALLLLCSPLAAQTFHEPNGHAEWQVSAPAGPADLRFEGPSVGDVGKPVIVALEGIEVDATKTLDQIFNDVGKVSVSVNAPDGAKVDWKSKLNIDPIKRAVAVELSVTADTAGVYVLIADWNESPYGLALHRLVIGGVGPQPPPVVVDPDVPPVDPVPTDKVTAAFYVYEKDATTIPSGVELALNELNRRTTNKIVATLLEDPSDSSPPRPIAEANKVPLAAAKAEGLPALVVMAGNAVLKVVKSPTTKEQVMEAVQ